MLRHLTFPAALRMVLAVAGLTLGGATACGKDGATAPEATISGSYNLTTIDGDDPPVTVYDGQARLPDGQVVALKVSVIDSELSLDRDGSYFMAVTLRVSVDGNTATQSLSNEGSFDHAGSSLAFESDDPDISDFRGTLAGSHVTLHLDIMGNGEEYAYVYSKSR
jgi:hypothetical protein